MTSGPPDEVLTDQRLEDLERRMDGVEQWQRDAVPNGDHVGHCRYHQLMIEEIEAKKKLRQAVLEKSIAGLVWATLLFVGLASWNYVASLIRRGG